MKVNIMSNVVDKPQLDVESLNQRFENASTEEILEWTWDTFGPLSAASSSFQTQSLPLLHIISCVCPQLPVLFLDTGFHFEDTLGFRDQLQERLGLNIINVHPAIDKKELIARYGSTPYDSNPDLCCYINKVEPMRRAMENYSGWISGIRRDQTKQRQGMKPIQLQADGPVRIHPMLSWTRQDVADYIQKHNLPKHPLHDHGYVSIGCRPCTRAIKQGEDERAGRWAGQKKKECGLHYEI